MLMILEIKNVLGSAQVLRHQVRGGWGVWTKMMTMMTPLGGWGVWELNGDMMTQHNKVAARMIYHPLLALYDMEFS